MDATPFQKSLADGRHALLQNMVGEWVGRTRVWFEPSTEPALTLLQRGHVRPMLGGRFLFHEYAADDGSRIHEGIALYGWHLERARFEVAWGDDFHTGTGLMLCAGAREAPGFHGLGSYPAVKGPDWGWRIELAQDAIDTLRIAMFNIPPDGPEALAVETLYRRAGTG
ncbi:DUF1579 family protein [Coralloluteibacterium thermophilus]|uniref:DUF1579 family protein n=1 Tax=Coralloluteibacterium thermophilum TaxID=2707049 RepID=A0ABV9NLB3_9GAMM